MVIKDIIKQLPKIPPGKGKRLILLHAGFEDGFLPGMVLVFEGKSSDYYQEMISSILLEWFQRLCT